MHAEMVICGTNIWFADEAQTVCRGENISLSATLPTGKEATAVFNALCDGGKVMLPPTDTFYSVFHAAVKDKYGIIWNVVAEEAPASKEN
jgi:PhnB protein